jgi:hypothetical protein
MSTKDNVNRRRILRIAAAIAVAGSIICAATVGATPAMAQQQQKPNIVIIWGDDIGQSNISAYTNGLMGLPHAKHRLYRYRRDDLHRLLWRAELRRKGLRSRESVHEEYLTDTKESDDAALETDFYAFLK